MLERIEDSESKRRLLVIRNQVMMVGEGIKKIEDATDVEKAYIAGIIDGEGSIVIKGRARTKEVIVTVGMEDLLPYMLYKKYGGGIYNRYAKPRKDGSKGLCYEWYVGPPKPKMLERLRKFIIAIMPFSRVKKKQFGVMLEAIDLKLKYYHKRMPDNVVQQLAEIQERLHKLNHTDPPYIKLQNGP